MINRLISHFDSLFLEIKSIENLLIKENHTKTEALEVALRACSLAKNPCSEIHVVKSVYLSTDKNFFNQFELALFINQLLRKHDLLKEFTVTRKASKSPYGSLFDMVRITTLIGQTSVSTEEYFEEISKVNASTTALSLIDLAVQYLSTAHHLIQEEILTQIAIKTYLPKYSAKKEISETELKYYNKWIDGTIEFSDLASNSHYDFISYIHEQKLPYEHEERIEAKQAEIFKEGLARKTRLLAQEIDELEEPKKSLLLHSHDGLLERFLDGDVDELLIDRIDKFIKIDNPKEVLLAYDDLIISNYYDYNNLTVYKIGRYRMFSPTFTAHLIYAYLQILKNAITIKVHKKIKPKTKSKTIISRIAFHFKGDPEQLKSVFTALQHRIDLLKNSESIESLVSIFLSEDIQHDNAQVNLDCETQQFAYVITRLKPYFSKLTAKGIEDAKSFYSKNGVLIKANNLHGKPPKGVKQQDEIDKIISQMK
ncbi:MAG: hypothetical protein RL308_1978 [Bacteroidota bacterium]|jgi:hypothetical protein